MQHQRFVMLGIDAYSYNVVVWVTSQLSRHLNNWRRNRKLHASIPNNFELFVREIRKTSTLPNIRNDAINALIELMQGSMSYANYAEQFNDFFYEGIDSL
jgi:predicted ATPase